MKQSEKVGLYSILVNLFLVGIKVLLFLISGSVALMADAIHSFSDVISSATVLAGIKISKRKSKGFPYGLYKVENFVSLLSSVFIFIAGYEIVKTVFNNQLPLHTQYLPYAIGGVLVTMGITFSFSRYELKQGKEIGSPSLMADGQHIRTDMLASTVIMAGLIGGWFGFNLDKVAALLVVFLVFKAGLTISIDAIRVLLDASIGFETMDKVKSIILKEPGVVSINALLGRNSGPFKFIEADIVIKAKDLEKALSISQKIEKKIRQQVSHVDHILIHYEPQRKETTTYAIPLKEDKKVISDHFGNAPCFQLIKIQNRDGAVLSEEYYKNPFAQEEKGKGIRVSEWLLEKGVDTVCSPREFKRSSPGYVFSDAGVDIIVTDRKTLEEVLQSIKN